MEIRSRKLDKSNYSRLAIRGVKKGNDNWKRFDEFNVSEQEYKTELRERLSRS